MESSDLLKLYANDKLFLNFSDDEATDIKNKIDLSLTLSFRGDNHFKRAIIEHYKGNLTDNQIKQRFLISNSSFYRKIKLVEEEIKKLNIP